MRKLTIILFAVMLSFAAFAQKPSEPVIKKDSMVLQLLIDTTSFKDVILLIQENINSQTKSGKIILTNILQPLYRNARLVPVPRAEATKPKDQPKTK